LPFFLAQVHIKGLNTPVDPCAAILVLIVTALLCLGIKEVLVRKKKGIKEVLALRLHIVVRSIMSNRLAIFHQRLHELGIDILYAPYNLDFSFVYTDFFVAAAIHQMNMEM
jgi:hypothetical protein